MAQEQSDTRAIPPYVPYKTFRSFLESLRAAMPDRIDRSLMGTMSGATQGQLISALRFLGVIAETGAPTQALKSLVTAEGQDRQEALQTVISKAYEDVFEDVNLETGTYRQLHEAFAATGAQGDTVRKCIAFWLLASRDADLSVSPHFSVRGSRAATRSIAPRRRKASQRPVTIDDDSEQPVEPVAARTRFEILVEKFPTFDPSWEAEVQSKWFTAFERLQSLAPGGVGQG